MTLKIAGAQVAAKCAYSGEDASASEAWRSLIDSLRARVDELACSIHVEEVKIGSIDGEAFTRAIERFANEELRSEIAEYLSRRMLRGICGRR